MSIHVLIFVRACCMLSCLVMSNSLRLKISLFMGFCRQNPGGVVSFSFRGSSCPRYWIRLSCEQDGFLFNLLIHLGSPNFICPSVELKMIRERNNKYFSSKSQGSTLIKDPDYRKWTLCKQNNLFRPQSGQPRGLHHFWRLCVQGQHTKTMGCHGCPMDVSNKE